MDMTRMLGSGEAPDMDGQQEERGSNPLLVLHLLLQGRYWLAIVLAVIFGAIAGVLGHQLTKQTFTCTGMVQIRPVISSPMFGRDGTMPMYEQFVNTQVESLKSQRCIDLAMASPRWLDGGKRNNSEATAAEFKKKLTVTNSGELIRVVYTDPNPKNASDAVAALIEAYQSLVVDLDPDQPFRTQNKLETLKADYETKLQNSRLQVQKLASPYTPEALTNRHNYKQTESNQSETEFSLSRSAYDDWRTFHPTESAQLDEELRAASEATQTKGDGAVAAATKPATTGPATLPAKNAATVAATQGATTAPAEPITYTIEHISQFDAEMRNWVQMRGNLQSELETLQLSGSMGPQHPVILQKVQLIKMYTDKIDFRAAHWKPSSTGTQQVTAIGMAPTMDQLSVGKLMFKKMMRDKERFESVSSEAISLGKLVGQIQEEQASQQQTVSWLTETKQKLEELRVQQNASGRISVWSTGDRPELKDRRIPVAAASGLGGAALGFAIIIVWGLLDRRLRTIDQARMSLKQGMRVLGMLPSLPKNLADPAAASFAALCVHHIRMLLQVMPRLDGHPAIAVTSPSPGDGKTSLTMALALSFAASGKSTLLIDCDIVGAGLTRRVNAIIRRRIGQILIRENLLTPAELREALSAAQRTGRKLGEVLVDEGFLDAEQLSKALRQQGETSVGLLDVMRGEVLEDCVAETGTPRLWILPVGSALAEHGATISPEGFRAVLDQARKRFDVILVDTGPVPGAIESSVAASQVDGVVLTVSRGEQGPLVKRAAEHLRDIGGRVLGLVFNRATPEDFSSSYGSMSSPSIPERIRDKPGTDMSALGPVAAAVAGHQKTLREGKE